MTALTHDEVISDDAARAGSGLGLALVSALTFGASGALASPLLRTGWTPGAVVLVRIGVAALVVVPFGVRALRGRWSLLRATWLRVVVYGVVAVGGCQFCYFSAVSHMDVGPALLLEYTAPALVVVWLWLRHGQRPSPVTVVGAVLCAAGLVLVLDLLSGADLSAVGVAWALCATVGCAYYFVVSADDSSGLPSVALAAGGMVVATVRIGGRGLVGLLPLHAGTTPVSYAGTRVAWWLPALALGLVTAAIAYVSGIEAGRRLGSRVASFVALAEVVAGVLWAWLLLSQLPGEAQLAGGVLILAGVVAVKAGEPDSLA